MNIQPMGIDAYLPNDDAFKSGIPDKLFCEMIVWGDKIRNIFSHLDHKERIFAQNLLFLNAQCTMLNAQCIMHN